QVAWSDICGYEDLKETIRGAMEWPVKYAHLFKKHHIPSSSGLLLYGPPGCSKTMIAKAVATQCGFNFFAVKSSDLLSKYVGQSEKNVRNLFARARRMAPSVIFFDEIESLAVARDRSDTNSTNSLLSTMLTEMDGVVALCGVFVLGATNMPSRVDKVRRV
ncbi:hypothetical protein HELRODRAFT_78267, partial [Helobdella robusta]|uniref:AAA+ ATPase domain-containing protein n=1 Tax=Helobdella robusta TaxID=6412 RepID=T1G3A1_HELRO